ncbi:MAG: S4 domain-containing protein [Polyangia bacterium]|jgi:pseudouridine synthase
MTDSSKIRLHKLLAQAGIASRRRAEAMIQAGEVKVDGKVVTQLGTLVDPHGERVEVNGRRIKIEAPHYRVLLKPRACLATFAPSAPDSAERRSIARFVPDREIGWHVVAPLDFLAEGVILLTTDGTLAERMSRGGGHVPMTYHLKFQGEIGDEECARLRRGWKWEGRSVEPLRVAPIATTGKNTWVEMVVKETRARALRAAGELIRHSLLKISRVRLGGISFEGLKMGGFRDLTKTEVKALLAIARETASRAQSPDPPERSPARRGYARRH